MSSVPNNQIQPPLVSLSRITKAYPGCMANDGIDLTLEPGKVHALLGENGAGKSTLVKILYGLLQADAGSIQWQGREVSIASPAAARELGIAMVFQHFSLFDSLTVVENIALGMAVPADDALRSRIVELSSHYGLPLAPDRSVYSLSVGERQRIEIVRCLLQDPKLLIMDEPTSVLTPQEVEELFNTLRRLADEGLAILYISHKLDEIRQLCSEATILRNGRLVATADPGTESAGELAALMMGEEISIESRPQRQRSEQALFCINKLNVPAADQNGIALRDIELIVNAGEVVGIAGVAGNGQDEFMQLVAGEVIAVNPEALTLRGSPVGNLSPRNRRMNGLRCVPEERLGHATVPGMSLARNAMLTNYHQPMMKSFGLYKHGKSTQLASDIIDQFNVQCSGASSLASTLSGGNLQKFIVGREILQKPAVLVVSQPTWGVDAGAAVVIHAALQQLAAEGSAVIIVSQDLDELMANTDRIGALCAGSLSALHTTNEVTMHQVGLLMGGEAIT